MLGNQKVVCTCDTDGRAYDPTGTGSIRRAWRTDARVRVKATERRIHNLILANEGVVSADALVALASKQMMDKRWWARFVLSAYRKGMDAAARKLAIPQQNLNSEGFSELDHLVNRTGDEFAAVVTEMAHQIALVTATAIGVKEAQRLASDRISAVGEYRANLVIATEAVAACAYGTLRVYKDNGIKHITIIPEGIRPGTMVDFNPNHEPAGSPKGGEFARSDNTTLYHGTTSDVVDAIKKEGLRADVDKNYGKAFYLGTDRSISVYLTSDQQDAWEWAERSPHNAPSAVVLTVHIPKSAKGRLFPDDYSLTPSKTSYKFKGDIPASWIKKIDVGPAMSVEEMATDPTRGANRSGIAWGKARQTLVGDVESDDTVIYAVILCDGGKRIIDAKHSRRGPGGRFASIEAELAAWETARDNVVCPACAAMEGKIFDMEDSEDLIPLHPNCRCAWAPLDDNSTLSEEELLNEGVDPSELEEEDPTIIWYNPLHPLIGPIEAKLNPLNLIKRKP